MPDRRKLTFTKVCSPGEAIHVLSRCAELYYFPRCGKLDGIFEVEGTAPTPGFVGSGEVAAGKLT